MATIRERFAAALGMSRAKPDQKSQGRSGTVNTRGFLQDREQNLDLLWPQNLDMYELMVKTDPMVRWMLGLIETPIRSATWDIEPAGPEPAYVEQAAFVKHNIFDEMAGGWDEALRQILTYLRFGHSVFERVAALRDVEFTFDLDSIQPNAEGALVPQKTSQTVKRQAFVLAKLAPRLQRTIYQWNVADGDPSSLRSITQQLSDGISPQQVEIDGDRLVLFVNEKEGDDWRGLSLLRSVWKVYTYKMELENLEAIAYERSAGLPVVYPPSDADDDQLDQVEDMLKGIRKGDNLYALMPGPKAGSIKDAEGWLFEDVTVSGEGSSVGVADVAIQRYDSQIAHNVLAGFMRLGHETTGARATADVQQDPYYKAIQSHVEYIEDVVTDHVIRPLIDWNYETDRYPRLKAARIQSKDLATLATTVATLITAGGITATPELEAWARNILGAPEKPLVYDQQPVRPRPAPLPGAGRSQQDPAKPGEAPADGSDPGEGAGPGEKMTVERFAWEPPRPLVGGERYVAWAQVAELLTNGPDDLVQLGEQVMGGQLDSALEVADEAVTRNDPDALERLTLDPVPLADALEAELQRLYVTGRADVRAEVRRLASAQDNAPQPGQQAMAPPKIPLSSGDVAKLIRAAARNLADSATQAALRAIKARAVKSLAQRRETPPAPGENPKAALRAALRAGATPAVNRFYSLGRMDELQAQAHAGFVDVLLYSAVLDERTCEECAAWDGEVARPGNVPVDVPNPLCAGGDACRCQWVADVAAPGDVSV